MIELPLPLGVERDTVTAQDGPVTALPESMVRALLDFWAAVPT